MKELCLFFFLLLDHSKQEEGPQSHMSKNVCYLIPYNSTRLEPTVTIFGMQNPESYNFITCL